MVVIPISIVIGKRENVFKAFHQNLVTNKTMQLFTNQKIKIGLAVLLAFLAMKTMSAGGVFLGDTPRIHPFFITRLINAPAYLISKLNINTRSGTAQNVQLSNPNEQPAPFAFTTTSPSSPPDLEYKPIAQGVYAAEDTKTNTVYVNIKKGTIFTVVNKVINGKTFRLLIPKN